MRCCRVNAINRNPLIYNGADAILHQESGQCSKEIEQAYRPSRMGCRYRLRNKRVGEYRASKKEAEQHPQARCGAGWQEYDQYLGEYVQTAGQEHGSKERHTQPDQNVGNKTKAQIANHNADGQK